MGNDMDAKKLFLYAIAGALLFTTGVIILGILSQEKPNTLLSNLTKKKSARISMETADSAFSRMRGLMFREKVVPIFFIFDGVGMYPIHSKFVPAEFDAIWISPNGTAVDVIRRIPPNQTLIRPSSEALYLLELPPEITDRLKIEEGDRLGWKTIK
ncbi:TPA: hypothetical protein HA225_02090 [Candidatus Micrarchaeota archaeon]|nr:hypothetical protein [Candidatus Micrarchaeota archaeon]HIH30521.1 hypothetical protein [Candidatus Micrarchaeota archaeon]HLD29584.1 DUF192 domain-containing protein [bacterium]